MNKQNEVLNDSVMPVRKEDLPGEWLALGEGWEKATLVKISEDGTYRFGPDLRQDPSAFDDRVYEQGLWELRNGVLSFVSNVSSKNCGQGERGDYRLTRLDVGNLMLSRVQDQCTARSHDSVKFERVQAG